MCLEDNINNENSPQPVISAHIGTLFEAMISLCFSSSHLVSAALLKAARAEHMFHPKGLSVLNCDACILCGTKGAYVKNEQ